MQFRVPQNIAMEDRLVGSLTAIQFGILVIGGFFSFFLYSSTFLPNILRTGSAVVLALLTIVLALGKFNDQPMYRFFKYIIAFIVRPKTRIWHKGGKEIQLIQPKDHSQDIGAKTVTKKYSKADIARLAAMVDNRGKNH